ncbi:hypothetical protein HNO83_12935 [Leifsonia sp. C5G2]|nr:hypothetical protein [Leifsonia sp. C5G2]
MILVVGPNIPESLLRRHCVAALRAGNTVALVQLRPSTAGEGYLLRALARWYGKGQIALVEDHRDWLQLPERRRLVVLSERGLWRDDERVAEGGAMLAMSSSDVAALY